MPPTFGDAVLLVNTKSRRGAEWFEGAGAKLEEHGVKVREAKGFAKAKDLIAEARLQANKCDVLMVGGGDGTLSAVANILARGPTAMGVVPLGTGNAFARDLGIPVDLDEAAKTLAQGHIAPVDLGVHDEGFFLNVATIGLSTQIAESLTVALKRRFGRFVYAFAMFKALSELKPFRCRLETENGVVDAQALQVVIGNGHYHAGPFPLSPDASITSGKQHLYIVEGTSKAALIKYALALPTGYQGALREVHAEDCVGGSVATTPSLPVTIDGEIASNSPMRFSVAPGALRVVVPENFESRSSAAK